MNDIISAAKKREAGERANKYFEIIACLCGGKIICGGEEISFSSGKAIVIPPRAKHTVVCEGENLHVLLERSLLPYKKPCVIDDAAGGIAFAANEALKYAGGVTEKERGVLYALGELISAYASAAAPYDGLTPAVATIKQAIEKNLSDPLFSVEDELKKIPLNYDYMRKLFKKETGETPRGYLNGRRMELAKKLLAGGASNRYTQYSVAQVAEACGFSEPLYFSRVFKKYAGVPPSEYAALARN